MDARAGGESRGSEENKDSKMVVEGMKCRGSGGATVMLNMYGEDIGCEVGRSEGGWQM